MKRYRVEKIDGEMVVTEDRKGLYRAASPNEIQRALTELEYCTTTAEVLIGRIWFPLGRRHRRPIRQKRKQKYSEPTPIRRGLPLHLKILRKLHLYKDPLEILIYNEKRNGHLRLGDLK